MTWLENRIPPPLVALALAILMWLSTYLVPGTSDYLALRSGAGAITLICAIILLLPAVRAFRKKGTTINPVTIGKASVLVTDGIFGLTRNPMYLGMALVLVAWAFFLGSLWALLGPISLVLYLTQFQIRPEERVLGQIFGQPYVEYCNRVRRWI